MSAAVPNMADEYTPSRVLHRGSEAGTSKNFRKFCCDVGRYAAHRSVPPPALFQHESWSSQVAIVIGPPAISSAYVAYSFFHM